MFFGMAEMSSESRWVEWLSLDNRSRSKSILHFDGVVLHSAVEGGRTKLTNITVAQVHDSLLCDTAAKLALGIRLHDGNQCLNIDGSCAQAFVNGRLLSGQTAGVLASPMIAREVDGFGTLVEEGAEEECILVCQPLFDVCGPGGGAP